MSRFERARKEKLYGTIAISGPGGSGKTWTALTIARELADRVAVIDSENGSSKLYADVFDFDVLTLESFAPQEYIAAIEEAQASGYGAIVIDSLSHAWSGPDGVLEQVDRVTRESRSSNSFSTGWRTVSPIHARLVDAIVRAQAHMICTLRVKTEWTIERTDSGKMMPKKVGLKPVQRDDLEYEFSIVASMDADNVLRVHKSRCPSLQGAELAKPGADLGRTILAWLSDGDEPPPRPERKAPEVITSIDVWSARIMGAATQAELTSIADDLRRSEQDPHVREQGKRLYLTRKAELKSE